MGVSVHHDTFSWFWEFAALCWSFRFIALTCVRPRKGTAVVCGCMTMQV